MYGLRSRRWLRRCSYRYGIDRCVGSQQAQLSTWARRHDGRFVRHIRGARQAESVLLIVPHQAGLKPPMQMDAWYANATLHVQNIEGGVYEVPMSTGAHRHGGSPRTLSQLHAQLGQHIRPPVWLISGSFYPLTTRYAAGVLELWLRCDFVALRESHSAHNFEKWRARLSTASAAMAQKRTKLTVAQSLDVALLAPIYEFAEPLAEVLAERYGAWTFSGPSSGDNRTGDSGGAGVYGRSSVHVGGHHGADLGSGSGRGYGATRGGDTFRVALMTSSRRDGWSVAVAALLPALVRMAAGRPLHVRIFIPVDDDVHLVRQVSLTTSAHSLDGSNQVTVDVAEGDAPLEQAFQLSRAQLLVTGRYHGVRSLRSPRSCATRATRATRAHARARVPRVPHSPVWCDYSMVSGLP